LANDDDETFLIKSLQDKQASENLQLKIDRNINIKAVQNSLDNIFSWIPGERILNPEFGNNLYKYLYEGITEYTEELIVAEIKNCVLRWEPRVSIINVYNVSTVQDTEDNTIVLDIEYYINGLEGTIYRKEYRFNRNEE
jgi:phage baseplate assembly protein W